MIPFVQRFLANFNSQQRHQQNSTEKTQWVVPESYTQGSAGNHAGCLQAFSSPTLSSITGALRCEDNELP